MNFQVEDILQPIPYEDVPKLKENLKSKFPSNVHAIVFLETCIRWKRIRPTENYVTIYSPNGTFDDGTFVAIIEIFCYEVFIYTMDKTLQRLRKALRETKVIDWTKKPLFAAVEQEYFKMLVEVRNEINHPISNDNPSHVWWLPKEKAYLYTFKIPPSVYVAPLNESHVDIMNSVWPHRFPGSEKYLAKLLELNGGIGLFSNSTNELCCWVLKNYFGGLGVLQTAEAHKRKGYGALIAKIFSKMIAEGDGFDVTGFIVNKNFISQNMFTSLDFEKVTSVTWCEC